jgi:hypothetical protein
VSGLLGSVAAPALGLGLFVASALVFAASPREALFLAGLGALLLGVGGIARVSIAGGVVVGSAGFVMLVLGTIVP